MATVSELIENLVRVNLSDTGKSRFEDSDLLAFFKQAIRRAQGYGYTKKYNFMKKAIEVVIKAGDVKYLLPTDMIVISGLWNKDLKKKLILASEDEWETTDYNEALTHYIIDGLYLNLAGASTSDTSLRIKYYYNAGPDALTLTTQMPWNGRLDYPICQYVTMRAQNIDKYSLKYEQQLLMDMEQAIDDMFVDIDQTIGEPKGAF